MMNGQISKIYKTFFILLTIPLTTFSESIQCNIAVISFYMQEKKTFVIIKKDKNWSYTSQAAAKGQ